MELDDLKVAWAELESRVGQLETVVVKGYQERAMDGARRVLRTIGWYQAIQSVCWIFVIAFVAPFWITHRSVPHLLIAGLVLHAYGVLTVCSSVVQLLWIIHSYLTTPVVRLQRRLAELQRLRIISGLAVGLPWWLLWVPATMVFAEERLGIDLYAQSPGWIHASLGFGAIGIVLTLLVARYLANHPPTTPFLRRMIDDLAGRSLVRATRHLNDAVAFARD
jgi:hypothetical protein